LPQRDGANKKADVIAMMRRTKGVTLQKIMEHTGWPAHTRVHQYSSKQGRAEDRVIDNEQGSRTYRITR